MATLYFTFLSWIFNFNTAFAETETTNTGSSGKTLPNPLGEGTTIYSLLSRIMTYLLELAIPVATVMILYGAFQILTAGDDSKKYESGKDTIKWTVIGFVIILLASGIPSLISELLGADTSSTDTSATGSTYSSVVAIITNIGNWMFGIILALSVVFLLYAAFLYVTSAQDEKNIDKAKDIIKYVVIAIIIAVLTNGIIAVVQSLVGVTPVTP